jgi:hypothetical protein
MTGYRQRQDSDTWHFCVNCLEWPRVKYLEQWEKPTRGQICEECHWRKREGRCRRNEPWLEYRAERQH